MSRCAPASDAPTTARGSRHTSAPQLPARVVVARGRRQKHGAQLVGDDDVAQRVERRPARARLGDLADRRALERLVLGRERLDDREALPVREAAEHARVGRAARPRRAAARTSGSASSAQLLVGRAAPSASPSPGACRARSRTGSRGGCASACGQRQRDDTRRRARPRSRRPRAGPCTSSVAAALTHEHVPVQRPVRGRATWRSSGRRASSANAADASG